LSDLRNGVDIKDEIIGENSEIWKISQGFDAQRLLHRGQDEQKSNKSIRNCINFSNMIQRENG